MGDSATTPQYHDCCRIVRSVGLSVTSLYSEVVAYWQEAHKVVDQAVGSVPVNSLQSLVRDDIAGRGKLTSVGYPERHLLLLPILLPMCRRSVPVKAITEATECTPPQPHSIETPMKNRWRTKVRSIAMIM